MARKPAKPKPPKIYKRSINEKLLECQLKEAGIDFFTVEYMFHQGQYFEKRNWRADIAFLDDRILIEIQGGTFKRGGIGRHNSGTGYSEDREKSNAAQEEGWMILEYDVNHIKKGYAIEQICRILNTRRGTSQFSSSERGRNQCSDDNRIDAVVGKSKKRKAGQSKPKGNVVRRDRDSFLRGLCRTCSRKKTECVCTAAR